MMPIGPLMIEHRLIERMLSLFAQEHDRIEKTGRVNFGFLDTAIDFFKNYVDKFHHGKEEDILFHTLDKKPLSEEDRKLMNELIEEHARTRTAIKKLDEARRHIEDNASTSQELLKNMSTLIKWYPVHIEKEDKHFFIPAINYLTGQEQASMLEESREFDRNFVQHMYVDIITKLEIKASADKKTRAA